MTPWPSAAAKAAREPTVDQVVICTPDKDLGQCVVGTRVVQLDRRRLRLIFICCHTALPQEGHAALTLREICGLTWLKKMQWLSISVSPNDYLIETNLNRRKKCLPRPISSIQPNSCSSQ